MVLRDAKHSGPFRSPLPSESRYGLDIPDEENAILRVHQTQVLCSIRPVRSSYVRSPVFGGNKVNELLVDFLCHFWAFPALYVHRPHVLGGLIPANGEKCPIGE
jgi:hypothetical protein